MSLEERKIAIADEAISELTREPIIDFGWEKARENSYRRTITAKDLLFQPRRSVTADRPG